MTEPVFSQADIDAAVASALAAAAPAAPPAPEILSLGDALKLLAAQVTFRAHSDATAFLAAVEKHLPNE